MEITKLTKDEDYQEALDMLRAGNAAFSSTGFEYHSGAIVLTSEYNVYWEDRDRYEIVPGIYKSQQVHHEWSTLLIRQLTKRQTDSEMPRGIDLKTGDLIRPLTSQVRGGCGKECLKMGVWIFAKYFKFGNQRIRELMKWIHIEEWNIVAREYERLSKVTKRNIMRKNWCKLAALCWSWLIFVRLRKKRRCSRFQHSWRLGPKRFGKQPRVLFFKRM